MEFIEKKTWYGRLEILLSTYEEKGELYMW